MMNDGKNLFNKPEAGSTMAEVVFPQQLPPTVLLSSFATEKGHGQSVKFSPFDSNRIACAVGTEYGLQGQGFLYVLERNPETGVLSEVFCTDYRDNLFDVCWSETDPNILTTSAGDGWVQVWNLDSSKHRFPKVPFHELKGHKKEMSTVEWSPAKFGNTLLAACWDGTVCCYDLSSPWPLLKMPVSDLIVYQAAWSPHSAFTYASASQDGIMQLWDMQADNQKPQIYLAASENELLCIDWAKYATNMVVTGSSDCKTRGWDLRNYSQPVFEIIDHGHAVKKVKFSPFHPTTFASVSYDTTLRIFDFHASNDNLEIINEHSEFVYGLDWNIHNRNEIATCSWDQTLKIVLPFCLRGR